MNYNRTYNQICCKTNFYIFFSGSNKGYRQKTGEKRHLCAEESAPRGETSADGPSPERRAVAGDHGDGEQLLPRHGALSARRSHGLHL